MGRRKQFRPKRAQEDSDEALSQPRDGSDKDMELSSSAEERDDEKSDRGKDSSNSTEDDEGSDGRRHDEPNVATGPPAATGAAAATNSILRSWFDQSVLRQQQQTSASGRPLGDGDGVPPPGELDASIMATKLMQLQTAQRLAMQFQAQIEEQRIRSAACASKMPGRPPPGPPLQPPGAQLPLDLRKPAETLFAKHPHMTSLLQPHLQGIPPTMFPFAGPPGSNSNSNASFPDRNKLFADIKSLAEATTSSPPPPPPPPIQPPTLAFKSLHLPFQGPGLLPHPSHPPTSMPPLIPAHSPTLVPSDTYALSTLHRMSELARQSKAHDKPPPPPRPHQLDLTAGRANNHIKEAAAAAAAAAASDIFRCVWCQERYSSLAELTQHLKEANHTATAAPPLATNTPRNGELRGKSPAAGNGNGAVKAGGGKGGSAAKEEKNGSPTSSSSSPSGSSSSSSSVPRKLVRGQDVWLGKGQEQTRQILKCMWCGESFKSLADMTVHMTETQHYTKVISQEQLSSWKAAAGSASNSGDDAPEKKREEQGHRKKAPDQVANNDVDKKTPSVTPPLGVVTTKKAKLPSSTKEKRKKSLPVRKLLELERSQSTGSISQFEKENESNGMDCSSVENKPPADNERPAHSPLLTKTESMANIEGGGHCGSILGSLEKMVESSFSLNKIQNDSARKAISNKSAAAAAANGLLRRLGVEGSPEREFAAAQQSRHQSVVNCNSNGSSSSSGDSFRHLLFNTTAGRQNVPAQHPLFTSFQAAAAVAALAAGNRFGGGHAEQLYENGNNGMKRGGGGVGGGAKMRDNGHRHPNDVDVECCSSSPDSIAAATAPSSSDSPSSPAASSNAAAVSHNRGGGADEHQPSPDQSSKRTSDNSVFLAGAKRHKEDGGGGGGEDDDVSCCDDGGSSKQIEAGRRRKQRNSIEMKSRRTAAVPNGQSPSVSIGQRSRSPSEDKFLKYTELARQLSGR